MAAPRAAARAPVNELLLAAQSHPARIALSARLVERRRAAVEVGVRDRPLPEEGSWRELVRLDVADGDAAVVGRAKQLAASDRPEARRGVNALAVRPTASDEVHVRSVR